MHILGLLLIHVIMVCLTCDCHAAAGRNNRAMGLTLGESCYTGWADCLISGSTCVLSSDPSDPTKGICKCKPLFEEAGSPADRCIPTEKTPLDSAECETNDDCIRLVNTVCKTGTAGKKTCTCRDDHELDTALPGGVIGCKLAVCSAKPDSDNWCKRTPGGIPGSMCNAGKCVCPPSLSLIGGSCIDATSIACTSGTCPMLSSGTSTCDTTTQKCTCVTNSKQPGAIKFSNDLLECQANVIGNSCLKDSDCPITVSCLKAPNAPATTKGVCACGAYKRPRPDNSRCDSTLGLCCRNVRDCGMRPGTNGGEAFQCLRASVMEPLGTCGCPPKFQWDSVSCKPQPTPAVCLALPALP